MVPDFPFCPCLWFMSNKNSVNSLKEEFSLPIIIKDTDKYGVEYNNRLLYVNKDDIKEIIDNHNTDKNNSSGIAVLN